MKATRTLAVCALVAALGAADGRAGAEPAPAKTRVVTALDDARACAPLARGGFAVATGGGLVIVGADGSTRTLTSIDGLPETRVHAVVESSNGLWVGTEGGAALVTGLERPVVARAVRGAPVRAILVTSAGVHLGTWGEGVQRLTDREASPRAVASAGTGKLVTSLVEHDGALVAAYADGPIARMEGGVLRPLPGAPAHGHALASAGGRLFAGGLEGLYRVSGSVTQLSSVDARGLAPSGDRLLVATYGSGLLESAPSLGAALRPEPAVPRWTRGVAVLGRATGARVACAATTEGLYVDEGRGWRRVPLGGLPSNDVTALAVAGDRVAVGTFDRGAAIHERDGFRTIAGLDPDESVNAVAWQESDAGPRLWLGTAHGLVLASASGAVVRRLQAGDGLPSPVVRSILVLSRDRLLVGTEAGPAFVEGDRVVPVVPSAKKGRAPLESPMHATWALARGADGTLYIGTSTGLYFGKDGAFERASVASGDLADDWVTALSVESVGSVTDVFAGTYSGGVTRLRFDASGRRPRATQLGGGYINPDGLTRRGAELYAATMDGLLVRPVADDRAEWRWLFDASVGRDVTASRVVGHALWVASRRGITIHETTTGPSAAPRAAAAAR